MPTIRPRILAVDDDQAILSLVTHLGVSEEFDVATAASGGEAIQQLRDRPAELVLLDLRMPGMTGFDTLTALREVSPRSHVVLMTGYGTIESAVRAVKLGATDYLTKPFDLPRLRQLLKDVRGEWDRTSGSTRSLGDHETFCGMVGGSASMRDVYGIIRRLAPHVRTALITGETGTGKELVARALHSLGPRQHRRLVTVNCSAVVETLFESELFGHVRGAFTGATENKAGLFEVADGGTLFLDEVGELPPGAQAKLLRVLEDGEVQRVGSLEPRRVDVRVVAATNRDLHREVASGRFRSDLYYRLNVVQIHLPPLRERRGDIGAIAASFVTAFGQRLGKPLLGVTPGAEQVLTGAEWEGNVRQLRNMLERACIMADGQQVTEQDLNDGMHQAESTDSATRPAATVVHIAARATARLAEVEREHIVRVLTQVAGNKAVAARLLGVSRRAFYRQLERHGLHQRVPASIEKDVTSITPLERAS